MRKEKIPFTLGDIIELEVNSLSYDGGRGVGRYQGFVVFVAQSAPGDLLRVKISEIKSTYSVAQLLSVVKPSPVRRSPPCPVVGECGGCPWQIVEYSEQLKQKKLLLAHALKKCLSQELLSRIEVVPAPEEYRYRNRVQVHVSGQQYGFFAINSRRLVPVSDCMIAHENIFKNLDSEIQKLKQQADMFKVEVAVDTEGIRTVRDLRSRSSEFTQVNFSVNQMMVDYVVNQVAKSKSKFSYIYDLYCGDGNIARPLSKVDIASKIIGVELNREAIERAKDLNSEKNGVLQRCEFVSSDVADYLRKLEVKGSMAAIVDPPRAGLSHSVIKDLLRLKPQLMVYISCNLMTLARDLSKLTTSIYKISEMKAFDMFPQTEFVETVVTLESKQTF